jgi:hypothetical protein
LRAAKRFRPFAAVVVAASAFLAASCATVPPLRDIDPLAALDADAAYYLVLPVSEHRALVRAIAERADGTGTLLDAADRTDLLYASVRRAQSGPELRAVAGGRFPRAAASFIFPASKGWVKTWRAAETEKGRGSSWYSRRGLSVSIPASGVALVSAGAGNASFSLAPASSPMPAFPAAFAARAAAARERIPGTPISLFVADPSSLVSVILGPDIALPVEYLEITAAVSGDGAGYVLSFHAAAPDERAARALRTLLRMTVNAEVTLSGRDVFVESYPVTTEKLADFAGFLYVTK